MSFVLLSERMIWSRLGGRVLGFDAILQILLRGSLLRRLLRVRAHRGQEESGNRGRGK